MDIFSDLFSGNIRPIENFEENKTYRVAREKYDECYENIKSELSKKNRRLLDEFWEANSDMEYEFGKQMFKEGFSLALRLFCESFGGKQKR